MFTDRWWRRHGARLLQVPLLALAAGLATDADAQARVQGKDAPVKEPVRVRFLDSGSGESKAAREKRLRRECKGRPNAGACLGLTR